MLRPWNPDAEKVFASVFGRRTLMTLYKMMNDKVFSVMYGEISVGKEANVFMAETEEGKPLILKIYRIEAADFNKILPYVRGDNRFDYVKNDKKSVIYAWAKKEFSNLSRYEEVGVRVPHPIVFRNNILAMELIEKGGEVARPLTNAPPQNPAETLEKIVGYMKLGHAKAGLVHADLSEYNILAGEDGPVIIDCGQSVLTSHPKAEAFLKRDVKNIAKYFRGLGAEADEKEMFEKIRKG